MQKTISHSPLLNLQAATVFLDEVGELALSLRANLLRVLQQRELERAGGTHTLKPDMRMQSYGWEKPVATTAATRAR